MTDDLMKPYSEDVDPEDKMLEDPIEDLLQWDIDHEERLNRVPDDGPCNDDPGDYVPDNREDNWHVY